MNKIIKTVILILIAFMFTAFGCKNADETQTTTQDEATIGETADIGSTDVSFDVPEPDSSSETTSDSTVAIDSVSSETTILSGDTLATEETQDVAVSDNSDTTSNDTTETDAGAVVDTPSVSDSTDDATVTESISTSEAGADDEVIKLSKTLAEIYGTFTNKDLEPYKNLKNLNDYSTEKMNTWIDDQVANYKASESTSFYGITTVAVSSGVLDSSDTAYTMLVTTEREEISEEKQSPNKYYQLLEMSFVEDDGEWLLDGAFWK